MTNNRKRVVLADDEMMMRQVLKSILTSGKLEVVGEAMNGNDVLQKCLQHKPDILCLDINMPGKSGIEALQEVRDRLPNLRVIMISGDASSETVKEAIALGANGFIVKPFNAAQVLNRIQQILAPQTKLKLRPEHN